VIVESEDMGVGLKIIKNPELRENFSEETKKQEQFFTTLQQGIKDTHVPQYMAIPEVLFQEERYM
jgi:hypothetical protein